MLERQVRRVRIAEVQDPLIKVVARPLTRFSEHSIEIERGVILIVFLCCAAALVVAGDGARPGRPFDDRDLVVVLPVVAAAAVLTVVAAARRPQHSGRGGRGDGCMIYSASAHRAIPRALCIPSPPSFATACGGFRRRIRR